MKNVTIYNSELWKKVGKKATSLALVGALTLGVGTLTSCSSTRDITPTPSATVTTTPTPVPTPSAVVTPTPEPTKEPLKLTVDNFKDVVGAKYEELKDALDVREDYLAILYLGANMNYLPKSDFSSIVGEDADMEKFSLYFIQGYNMFKQYNVDCKSNEYVSLSSFCFDRIDSIVLGELDSKAIALKKAFEVGTEEEQQALITDALECMQTLFVKGSSITIGEEKHAEFELSPGAGLLAETIGDMISDVITNNTIVTEEQKAILEACDKVNDGSAFYPYMMNYTVEPCEPTKSK